MSLTKAWFEKRDQFIEQQNSLGNYTLHAAMEKLNLSLPYLFDMGILSQQELSLTTSDFPQPTSLGGLFFVEQYGQVFITPDNLALLASSLEDWDNFSIDYELSGSDQVGKISVRNQAHIKFQANAKSRYQLNFHIEDIDSGYDIFSENKESLKLLNLWKDFSECVNFIEDENKSPGNVEVAEDNASIETLCAPWNKLVQNYFRRKMYEIGFESNLDKIKLSIAEKYTGLLSRWAPITDYVDIVRPERTSEHTSRDAADIPVMALTFTSIDENGFVDPEQIPLTTKSPHHLQHYSTLQPGDVVLFKNRNTQCIDVAYYSPEHKEAYLCSEFFRVLRSKETNLWDGKRLFLFFKSQSGQTLLEYAFRDLPGVALPNHRLSPRQLNRLQVPELGSVQAEQFDRQYQQLLNLVSQKREIEQRIQAVLLQE